MPDEPEKQHKEVQEKRDEKPLKSGEDLIKNWNISEARRPGRPARMDDKAERKAEGKKDSTPVRKAGNLVDERTLKELTEPTSKPKEYDLQKEVRDRLKSLPDIVQGKVEQTVLGEIGKLVKTYLEGVHELKVANSRAAEQTGILAALTKTTEEWHLESRGPHIQEGKPYTVEELKNRITAVEIQRIERDMEIPLVGNRTGWQDYENGFRAAVDGLNRQIQDLSTPQERQVSVKTFVETILPKISRDRQQRLDEIARSGLNRK